MRIGEKKVYEQLDPGVYTAELVDYTDTRDDGTPLMSNGYKGGEPKAQWRFRFELLDYPGEAGRQISAWINKPADMGNVAPNSNLVLMASALIPGLGPADDWDLPDLLHCQCRLQVETYTKQDGTLGTGIGKYYPAKTDKPAAAAPAGAAVPWQEQRAEFDSTLAARKAARPEPVRAEPVPTLAQRKSTQAASATQSTLDTAPPF